jgi:hypothetical protein
MMTDLFYDDAATEKRVKDLACKLGAVIDDGTDLTTVLKALSMLAAFAIAEHPDKDEARSFAAWYSQALAMRVDERLRDREFEQWQH